MKVLVINWRDIYHPEAGGAEVHIHELLKRKPHDWEVDFVSATFAGCSPKTTTPWYTIYRLPNTFFFNFSFKLWWKTIGKHQAYDLVIDDISKIPLATPRYITNVPLVAIMHHIHGESLYTILPWPLATYVSLMEKHLLRTYIKTPLFAVSPSTACELRALYPFQRLTVVFNGIGTHPISLQQKKQTKNPTPFILYLGRLKSYKRVDHFLRMASIVAKAFPTACFVIAGQGEEKNSLQTLASALCIQDKVSFVGFIDEETKWQLLRKAWILVIPSEKEGWGIVAIEANAMGTPVIGYDIPGLRDSVQHDKTGLLVETQTPEALAEQACQVLSDDAFWTRLCEGSLQWAQKFHWDEMAATFYQHIHTIMEDFHDRRPF